MQIRESSYSTMISGLIESSQPKTNKKDGQNLPDTQDIVSISAEGFALAQLAMENRVKEAALFSGEEDNPDNPSSQQGNLDSDKVPVSKTLQEEYSSFLYTPDGRKRADSSDSGGGSAAEEVEKKEKEIKKLKGQLENVYASDAPDMVKEQKAEAINSRIQVIMGELQALQKPSTGSKPAQQFAALA